MLRRAVSLQYAKQEELFALLNESEEHGHQRVYLYRLRDEELKVLGHGDKVAKRMFGEDWGDDFFPDFRWPENELYWSDFRWGLNGRQNDWILMAYGHSMVRKGIGESEPEDLGENVWEVRRRFKILPAYVVHVLRFRHPNTLELRIDKEGEFSKTEHERRFSEFTAMLSQIANFDKLTSFSIKARCLEMLKSRKNEEGKGSMRFGKVSVRDRKNGRILMIPEEESDGIDQSEGRSKALEDLLSDGATPLEASITWLFGEQERVRYEMEELPTHVGGKAWNEVSISKRINLALYEHTINRLCFNSRRS